MENNPNKLEYATPSPPRRRRGKVRGLVATIIASFDGVLVGLGLYDLVFEKYGHCDLGLFLWVLVVVVPLLLLALNAAVVSQCSCKRGAVDLLLLAYILIFLEAAVSIYILMQPAGNQWGAPG